MKSLLITILLSVLCLVSFGQTKTWSGGGAFSSYNWNSSSNWFPVGIPSINDDVIIPATDSVSIPAGYNARAKSITNIG